MNKLHKIRVTWVCLSIMPLEVRLEDTFIREILQLPMFGKDEDELSGLTAGTEDMDDREDEEQQAKESTGDEDGFMQKKFTFESVLVTPVKLVLTLRQTLDTRQEGNDLSEYGMTPTVSSIIGTVNVSEANLGVPEWVPYRNSEKGAAVQDATLPMLLQQAAEFYKNQIYYVAAMLLGASDLLGNFGKAGRKSRGMTAIMYEPAQAVTNPEAFRRGVAKGARKTWKSIAITTGTITSGFVGAIGSAGRLVAADEEFNDRYREQQLNKGKREKEHKNTANVRQGVSNFGASLVSGVTGIVKQPIKRAQNGYQKNGIGGGIGGAVVGVGAGLVGVIAKPVAGLTDMVKGAADDITNAAETIDQKPKPETRVTENMRFGHSMSIMKLQEQDISVFPIVDVQLLPKDTPLPAGYKAVFDKRTVRDSGDQVFYIMGTTPNEAHSQLYIAYKRSASGLRGVTRLVWGDQGKDPNTLRQREPPSVRQWWPEEVTCCSHNCAVIPHFLPGSVVPAPQTLYFETGEGALISDIEIIDSGDDVKDPLYTYGYTRLGIGPEGSLLSACLERDEVEEDENGIVTVKKKATPGMMEGTPVRLCVRTREYHLNRQFAEDMNLASRFRLSARVTMAEFKAPITELTLIPGDSKDPIKLQANLRLAEKKGFTTIVRHHNGDLADLNKGVSGHSVPLFLAYRRGYDRDPIRGIGIIRPQTEKIPQNGLWRFVDKCIDNQTADLSMGTACLSTMLVYTTSRHYDKKAAASHMLPIVDIQAIYYPGYIQLGYPKPDKTRPHTRRRNAGYLDTIPVGYQLVRHTLNASFTNEEPYISSGPKTANLNESASDYATFDIFLVYRSQSCVTTLTEESIRALTDPGAGLRASHLATPRDSGAGRRTTASEHGTKTTGAFLSAAQVMGRKHAASWITRKEARGYPKIIGQSSERTGQEAYRIMDNEASSSWYATKADEAQWLLIDLGEDYVLEKIQYWAFDEPNAPKDCYLQAGIPDLDNPTNVKWTVDPPALKWSGKRKNGWQAWDIRFLQAARYWRIVVVKTHAAKTFWGSYNDDDAVRLGEVKFYGAKKAS